jgi:hypothetical protein
MHTSRLVAVVAALALVACDDATTPPPAPTQLTFTTQPADDTVGSTLPTVHVTARDAQGAATPGFTGAVTLALAANPGGAVLSGTLTVNAVAGVATFSDLVVSKAEDGYTLTATSGSLTAATSAAFDIAEVTQRIALRYYWGLDLETGAQADCDIGPTPCPPEADFRFGYYAPSAPHAWFVTYASRTIASLNGRTFGSVHLADTAGAGFVASSGTPFAATITYLITTELGNVYKVGDPVEFGTGGADSVRFSVARLN